MKVTKKNFLRKAAKFAVAALLVSSLVVVGCKSDDDDDDSGSGTSAPANGSSSGGSSGTSGSGSGTTGGNGGSSGNTGSQTTTGEVLYEQNFNALTELPSTITVQSAAEATSEVANSSISNIINTDNPILESYGVVWHHYNISSSKGTRGAFFSDDFKLDGITSYIVEFDARVAPSNAEKEDQLLVTTATRGDGNGVYDYLLALTTTAVNSDSKGSTESFTWKLYTKNHYVYDTTSKTYNDNVEDFTEVELREDLFYHYKVVVNGDDITITITSTVNGVADPLAAGVTLKPNNDKAGESNGAKFAGIWVGCARGLLAEQFVDNIKVSKAN